MVSDIKLLVQIIIYFCIFVCGFAISIPLGIASMQFDNNCLLYAHFNKDGVLEQLLSSDHCNFPLYMSVIGCILYGLALACYNIYAFVQSRKAQANGTQLIVLPFVVINTVFTLMTLVAACMISVGFNKFCDGLLRNHGYNHCADAEGTTWVNLNTHKHFTPGNYYVMIRVSQIACWIAFVLYVCQLGLGILRFIRNRSLPPRGTQYPSIPPPVPTVGASIN